MERRMIFLLFTFFSVVLCQDFDDKNEMTPTEDILEPPSFVNWPNGSIPFYIDQDHFDYEQMLIITRCLSVIAFKTCLKFSPAMVAPEVNQHVLTFLNPTGAHKCDIDMRGHGKNEPHLVNIGYNCLQEPWLDRIVLRALGLPFEHNRQVRDTSIDVQYENIEQHAIPLYTKDIALSAALRALPYDTNSVMHFGERDFSKNGHRTIIFKDRETKQKWNGPSELDLRKIEIIYGPECRERDRQEKIELCHMYPGIPSVDRKKRSVVVETPKSLRVNPDITPPTDTGLNISKEVQAILVKLNIEEEVSKIVEDVFRVSSKALSNTRAKFCNATKENLRTSQAGKNDVLGIIELVAEYARTMVDTATQNLTSFCAESDSIDKYQRFRCADGCERHYYSTKNSLPHYSTRGKPYIKQSTKHVGGPHKPPYYKQYEGQYFRSQNDNVTNSNDTVTTKSDRKKRQVIQYMKDAKVESERSGANTEAPSRDGRRKHLSKWEEKHRAKYPPESERYASDSDQRVKRKKRPVREESDVDRDGSATNKRNRPKNNGREGKRNRKRPVVRDSEEKRQVSDSAEVTTIPPDSDERESHKKKRPVQEDSEEKQDDVVEDDGGQKKDKSENKKKKKQPEHGPEEKLLEKSEEPHEPTEDGPQDAEMSSKTLMLSKGKQEFYKQRRWPHGVVRYLIDKNCTKFDIEDLRSRLAQVNGILRRRTCARIQEIRPGEVDKYEDYLVLDNSPDYVTGRVGGRQIFGVPELLVGGQHRQHTAMVVMAMLGFYFELSRHDRDVYVKVHPRHIRADKLHHFEKISADATFPLPYDYESASHPAWMFWRKLGKTGISTVATYKDKDPDGSIMKSFGQHKKLLSEGDIIKINSVYGVKCMKKDVEKIESQINNPKSDWET